jgi:hypothetical protein
VPLSV